MAHPQGRHRHLRLPPLSRLARCYKAAPHAWLAPGVWPPKGSALALQWPGLFAICEDKHRHGVLLRKRAFLLSKADEWMHGRDTQAVVCIRSRPRHAHRTASVTASSAAPLPACAAGASAVHAARTQHVQQSGTRWSAAQSFDGSYVQKR
eukprot:78621-Chlamydomonas_euryale.AAC.5